MRNWFPNVKIPLNLYMKTQNLHKMLILAHKMNVRLVPLNFPQCSGSGHVSPVKPVLGLLHCGVRGEVSSD